MLPSNGLITAASWMRSGGARSPPAHTETWKVSVSEMLRHRGTFSAPMTWQVSAGRVQRKGYTRFGKILWILLRCPDVFTVEDVNTLFRNINTWKTHVLPFPQMNTNRIPQIQTWRQIAFSQIALSKGGTAQVVTNIQFTGWLMETEEWRMVSSLSFRFSVSGNVTWKKK